MPPGRPVYCTLLHCFSAPKTVLDRNSGPVCIHYNDAIDIYCREAESDPELATGSVSSGFAVATFGGRGVRFQISVWRLPAPQAE